MGEASTSSLENTKAKIFKTITLRFHDIDACIKQIENQVKKYPIDSYIRLRGKKDHVAMVGFDEIKKRFPYFVFSKITIEEELLGSRLMDEPETEEYYAPITITRENIQGLLLAELQSRQPLTLRQQGLCEQFLEEVC